MSDGQIARVGLRDYQREAVAATLAAYEQGDQRLLVALPTGTGKTVVGCHVAAVRPGRTIFLVHRDELVEQTCEKFATILPNVPVGVVKAERDERAAPIVVASIQTLERDRRLANLLRAAADVGPFQTVICDEAHHAPAPSWRKVLHGLRGIETDLVAMAERAQAAQDTGRTAPSDLIPRRTSVPGGPLVLGLTATPERGDKLALDIVWQRIVYERSILEMIAVGKWLADLRAVQVGLDLDLCSVRIEHGDFAEASLGAELTRQGVPAALAAAYQQLAPGRHAIVFVPTIAMAQVTLDAFRAAGITAELVTATTPRDVRRGILTNLRDGTLSAVINVGVLTEGFDAPVVDAILIGRPTRSRPLYIQMVGRGTRLYPGKAECLVLDLVGASSEHKIVSINDITGLDLKRGESVREAAEREEREAAARKIPRVRRTMAVNLFSDAAAWLKLADGRWAMTLPGGGAVYLTPTDGDLVRAERVQPGMARESLLPQPLRIDYAQGLVEDLARREGWWHLIDRSAPWRGNEASEKQRWLLRVKLGHERADDPALTRGEASEIIGAWKATQG